jgi:cytochrome c-type biogenesis protein CcmH
MVSRYGDFVLYRPRVSPTTWLLWAGPFVLMIVALAVLLTYLRRRNRAVGEAQLSEDETRRAEALLKE